jgi:hypothetical protein
MVSICFGYTPSQADDLDPIVRQLLVDHWDKGSKARNTSKTLFFAATASEEVLLAYTLNRIKHNRYREARVPADELTRDYPKNLDGWTLRIWLDAVSDNYDRSLIGIQMMKRNMGDVTDLDEAHAAELFSRVARVVGYLQGPVSQKVNQATLNATLVKFVNGMSAKQIQRFNDERNRVLDHYDQLVKQASDLQKVESEKATNGAKIEVAAIEAQNKAIDSRRQQIQPERNRIQTEGEQRVSALESQLSPLQSELAGLRGTIGSLEFTLRDVLQARLIQQGILLREQDPFVRQLIRDRLFQIDLDAGAIQNDLFNSRARADSVAVQLNSLLRERQRVGNQYSLQLGQLNEEARQNDRQQRRNTSQLKKIATGTQATSPKVRIANSQIDALSTYDPFPIEMFRQDYINQLTGN